MIKWWIWLLLDHICVYFRLFYRVSTTDFTKDVVTPNLIYVYIYESRSKILFIILASMSIPGTMYNFSTMQSSTNGRGSFANKAPQESSLSENVTSPLRPVSLGKIKIPSVADFYPEFKKMITGRLDDEMEIRLEKKIIYVFHVTYHTGMYKQWYQFKTNWEVSR